MRIRMRRPGNDFLDLGAAVRRGRRRRINIRRSGNDFLDLGAAVARGVVCLSEGRRGEGRSQEYTGLCRDVSRWGKGCEA